MNGPSRFAALLACSIVATAAPAGAQPAAPAKPAAAPDDLVRDLGSPAFPVRERATKALWALGEKARPALVAGVKSGDAEVAQRAQEILDKFDAGILPDTPPAVLKQIREFRGGLVEAQQAAVTALVKLGDPGATALQRLLVKDVPADNREAVFEHLAAALRTEVPRLLFDKKIDLAEEFLALNALGPNTDGLLDYATFLNLRGRAGQVVTELEALRKAGGPRADAAANALVFVARAAGDGARARAAAKELDKAGKLAQPPQLSSAAPPPPSVYESLLEDAGIWDELIDHSDGNANSPDGLKISRLRAAGRVKEAEELIDQQKDTSLAAFTGPRGGVDAATLALLTNDRPLDGIERMRTIRNAPHVLADLLAARLEFREALDLFGGGKKLDEASGLDVPYLRAAYDARRGRMLAQLGRRDAAAQVFARVADQVAAQDRDGGNQLVTQLIRAEVRAGRYDLACEHLGAAVARDEANRQRDPASNWGSGQLTGFEVLFDADADAAQFWWRALRKGKPANESAGATMTRVRALLTGGASKADFDHALACAGRGPAGGDARPLAVASAYRAAGRGADAVAELARYADALKPLHVEDSDSSPRFGKGSRAWVFGTDERFRFWLEFGDLLAEQGKHQEAAARYEQGWGRFPDNPVLLYLSGRALLKAGGETEGKRRTDLAHWVALGNARLRGRFLEELISRGHAPDARRECDLIRVAGWLCEPYMGNVWNQVARAAVLTKDFATAAAGNRRAVYYLLRTPRVSYVDGHAYLVVPQQAKGFAARELLAAGRAGEAVARAKECLAAAPANVDLVIAMVPDLDKLGRKKDADELFRLAWGAYAKVLADNPDSAWARYALAWLAAGCRRELDTALGYAKAAADLDPVPRSYKEALAEVHFRRGERAAAVALMKELTTADRRSHYYKRQVERYQTAGFDSPLPEGDDD